MNITTSFAILINATYRNLKGRPRLEADEIFILESPDELLALDTVVSSRLSGADWREINYRVLNFELWDFMHALKTEYCADLSDYSLYTAISYDCIYRSEDHWLQAWRFLEYDVIGPIESQLQAADRRRTYYSSERIERPEDWLTRVSA